MKTLCLFLILSATSIFSQENPWEPKSSENPWAVQNEEKDSVETIDVIESKDTIKSDSSDLLERARQEAKDEYRAGGDFAFGFANGAILNFTGVYTTLIYGLITTKKEKEASNTVNTDSTYVSIDSELLKKQTKKAVKNKKLSRALVGTLAGSLTQFAVLIGIITLL